MNIKIETKLLRDALKDTAVSVHSLTVLPILASVKISAEKGQLTFSATDLDLSVEREVEAEVETTGDCVVSHRLLQQLSQQFQDSRVTLKSTDDKLVEVMCGNITATLDSLPAAEFPPPLPRDPLTEAPIQAEEILEPFRMLKHAICQDQARYVLQGINLRPNGSSLDFAATTSTRLAVFRTRKLIDKDIIVPEQFVDALLKINPTGEGTIGVEQEVLTLTFHNLVISGKLIEGTFPNWRNVLPKKGDKVLSCNKSDFINAIKTCSIFTEKGLPGLKIAGSGKTLTVTRGEKAKVKLLGSELSGQPDFAIQFNSRHMLDTLNVLQNDDVRIQCVDESTPMLIEEKAFKEILVPVQLK